MLKIFPVWLDEVKRVVSFKEIPNAKQISFKDRNVGIQKVTEFALKGYQIG